MWSIFFPFKRLMNDWNRKWKSIWGLNWQNASLYDSLIKLSHILNGFSEQKRPNTFWTISYKNGHRALKMGLATRVRKIPIAQSDQTSFGFTTMGLNINWKNIFFYFSSIDFLEVDQKVSRDIYWILKNSCVTILSPMTSLSSLQKTVKFN